MNSQTSRILQHLIDRIDLDVPSVDLQRVGSGKENGWCASFTRRISDIRKLGYNVIKSKEESVNGQRHTFYKIIP